MIEVRAEREPTPHVAIIVDGVSFTTPAPDMPCAIMLVARVAHALGIIPPTAKEQADGNA